MYTMPKPSGSPPCWGKKYQDGDDECRQCKWNNTCRNETLMMLSNIPPRQPAPVTSLPVYGSPPPSPTTVTVPLPTRPTTTSPPPYMPPQPQSVAQVRYTPSAQPPAQPVHVHQPTYTQPTYQAPTYQPPTYTPSVPTAPPVTQAYGQPYSGYYIPDFSNPNPMVPMHRPGAQGPSYYFNQFPGETVAKRLTKNMVLRGFEALLVELANFVRQFPWAPRN